MVTEEIVKSILNFTTTQILEGGLIFLKKTSSQFGELIKNIFKREKKTDILNEYILNPECEESKKNFLITLKKLIEEDPKLIKEFEDLLLKMNTSKEKTSGNFQSGNNNISIQGNISNSSIKIHKN